MIIDMRHPFAYCVSAILGACVLVAFSAANGVDAAWHYYLERALFLAFIILVLMLPFWIPFSILASRLHLKAVFTYALSGAVLGVFAGTFYGACMPLMMWDTGPDLGFIDRGVQTFNHSSVRFAITGMIACSCYWFIAIRDSAEAE